MADQYQLSEKAKKKITDWLNERWLGLKQCPICRKNTWTIVDDLVSPNISRDGGLVIGGTSYPQVMVICGNCAHTLYFNAVMIGVVGGADEKASGDGASDAGQ